MSRLRRILDHADAGVRITTIRGSGYVLEPKRTAHFANPSHALDAARET
jgi:DNA-binding winged helix-turn-helix (wHTH) protein